MKISRLLPLYAPVLICLQHCQIPPMCDETHLQGPEPAEIHMKKTPKFQPEHFSCLQGTKHVRSQSISRKHKPLLQVLHSAQQKAARLCWAPRASPVQVCPGWKLLHCSDHPCHPALLLPALYTVYCMFQPFIQPFITISDAWIRRSYQSFQP